jgi:hypothetical protein
MNRGRTGPLRLLKTLRGDGTLVWGRRSTRAVSYSVDLYGQGRWLSGDGDVRGELSELVGRALLNVRLRLADGLEAPISIRDIDAESASIELVNPVPEGLE